MGISVLEFDALCVCMKVLTSGRKILHQGLIYYLYGCSSSFRNVAVFQTGYKTAHPRARYSSAIIKSCFHYFGDYWRGCSYIFYRSVVIMWLLNYFLQENCDLLGYYATSNGNLLPTFRDNLSVPSSGFENEEGKKSPPLAV